MPHLNVIFTGTSAFAVPSLQRLAKGEYVPQAVITRPDRLAGRGAKLSVTPVKEEALRLGLEVLQPADAAELLTILEKRKTHVLVNVAYGMILPSTVLQMPSRGCINLHPSLLPAYRGAAPIQRALMAGEKVTGVTVLFMSPKLDAGNIIVQHKVLIEDDENYGSLHDRLALEGAICLEDALDMLVQGNISSLPQEEGKASYAPPLSKEDELIDWDKSATEIYNKVRALVPSPGAYTIFKEKRLKILEVIPVLECPKKTDFETLSYTDYLPGTIFYVGKDCFHVRAGEGFLRVLELQPQGKRRMKVEDFLRGNPFKEGEKLG